MGELLEEAMRFRDALHQGWCQGTWAKNSRGQHVFSTSHEAVKWCLSGAAIRAGANTDGELFNLIGREARDRGALHHLHYNDHLDRTYAEILDFADCIVRRAKELEEA